MRILFIVLLSACFGSSAFCQIDTTTRKRVDSAIAQANVDSVFTEKLKSTSQLANVKLREKYLQQIAQSKQERLFASLRSEFQHAKDFLKTGIDTTNIERELLQSEYRIDIGGEGIFTNTGTVQTARNLATSSVLFIELGNRNNRREKQIDEYLEEMEGYRTRIDSLASDSMFLYIPSDSASIKDYLKTLSHFTMEIRTTDSALNATLKKMRGLKTKATIIRGNIESKLDEIEELRENLSGSSLEKEVSYLWKAPLFVRPFYEIVNFSYIKTKLVVSFYLKNHIGKIFLLLGLILGLSWYLSSLKTNVIAAMGLESPLSNSLVLNKPVCSAILIVLSIGQFIFPSPPFGFYTIIWILAGVALSIILWKHITAFWMKFWIISLTLCAFACFLNLILQASRLERDLMIITSLGGAASGLFVIISKYRYDLKERRLIVFLWFAVVLEVISIIANLLGRYNLSKAMMTTGFFGLVVGIQLLWTVRLLHEIFDLSAEAYREDEKKRYYIDFDKVGSEVPSYLYIILSLGWFILIGRNFYIYNKITAPFINFFTQQRQLGAYGFSFSSILLFVTIIFLSGLVSKLVSYFASGKSSEKNKKSGLASWMLLIRIAIFSIGFFLAFAATGIPMDRIAIVLGALSVGIGFGLQNLINNLVSGLIIAFEKPITVGDVVEIGGRNGTMKSIGFRSSVVSTFEGSEVIIPNGDLLNQHLINWTMNDNARRVEILVGVNYGTNLDNTIKLIHDILTKDARVRTYPDPFVLVNNFSNSSIDLRILFWVNHYSNWQLVRSDMMLEIKKCFDSQGIEIPYPQMVLHNRETAAGNKAEIAAGAITDNSVGTKANLAKPEDQA